MKECPHINKYPYSVLYSKSLDATLSRYIHFLSSCWNILARSYSHFSIPPLSPVSRPCTSPILLDRDLTLIMCSQGGGGRSRRGQYGHWRLLLYTSLPHWLQTRRWKWIYLPVGERRSVLWAQRSQGNLEVQVSEVHLPRYPQPKFWFNFPTRPRLCHKRLARMRI